MCGYLRRHIGPANLQKFLDLIEMPQLEFHFSEDGRPQHFYPAFGGVPKRRINDLVVREEGHLRTVNATWWYKCQEDGSNLQVINRQTTFNARNLHLDLWKEAIHSRRGIAVATEIGEAIGEKGKEKRFFVHGSQPLLLGCLYQRFSNGLYSCAVITRRAHQRFADFHDDAFPLMLPYDPAILRLWLSDTPADHPSISALLEEPRIFTDLTVTPVKTYKDAKAIGVSYWLPSDTRLIAA